MQCLASHTMLTHTFESCHPDMLFKYHQIWGNLSHHLNPVSQTCCSNFNQISSLNSQFIGNLGPICQFTLKDYYANFNQFLQHFCWSTWRITVQSSITSWTLKSLFANPLWRIHLAIRNKISSFYVILPIHFKELIWKSNIKL